MPATTWDLVGNGGNARGSFLGTTDAQPLVVKTSNAERLRVDSSGNVGIGTNVPGRALEVSAPDSNTGVKITGTVSNRSWLVAVGVVAGDGKLSFYDYGAGANRFTIDTSGKVGIGTTAPGAKLDVLSTTADIAVAGSSLQGIAVRAAAQKDTALFATSDAGMGVDARSNSNVAVAASSQQSIAVRAAAQTDTGLFATSDSGVGVDARSNSNVAVTASSQQGIAVRAAALKDTGLFATSDTGIGVDARSNSSAGVTASSKTGIAVSASSEQSIAVRAAASTDTAVFATSDSGMGVDARSNSNIGVQAMSQTNTGLFATSNSGRGVDARSSSGVGVFAAGGQYAGYFQGNIAVTGDVLLTGADCAEHFDTVSGDRPPDAGTVVVIGDGGQLRQSCEAYDRKVAGIVSGAGEYRPAIVLDNRGSDRNRVPIALVGKVYCKVDAQYGAIAVGDLLTSSHTPGHAMKASDANKAFGAILGKALRPLGGGTGLIPVLVSLQ